MSEGPAGVIIGGWPYVIAAYSITALALAANFARLAKRERYQSQQSQQSQLSQTDSNHKEADPNV